MMNNETNSNVENGKIYSIIQANVVYELRRSDYQGKHYYRVKVVNGGKEKFVPIYFKEKDLLYENGTKIRIKSATEMSYKKGYDEIMYFLVNDYEIVNKNSFDYVNEYNQQQQNDIKTPYDDIF